MHVNHVAFCTIVSVGGATVASAVVAAATVSTVATVAFATLAVVLASVSIASMTAWFASDERSSAEEYFSKVKAHSGIAIAGLFQYASMVFVQTIIHGGARFVSDKIFRRA
jgi:ABC-type glycerol-3-phosphate transport system substrate-binding protein